MKKPNPAIKAHTHTHTHTALRVFCSSLALLLSCALAPAQTPTPTPAPPTPDEPNPMPAVETLPAAYQPSAYSDDPSTLQRIRITPPAKYGPGPWPVAILIPPTIFKEGGVYGVPSERWAAKDLANAGFLVFMIDHRLAPPGFILNQDPNHTNPADGRPPEQSNDVKQEILAAYYDPQCNHQIVLIGGSSGGTHALWCALDDAPTVPGWPVPGVQVIKAVVGLSGPYDLSSHAGDNPQNLERFREAIENYTNTDDRNAGVANVQYLDSPISLVAAATGIPPIRLYATQGDTVPHQQAEEMWNALQPKGVDVMEWTIPNSNLHAFNYWHTMNPFTGQYVSVEVIAFLKSYLP